MNRVEGLQPEDTKVAYRFDLLPPRALMAAAQVMAKGCLSHPEDGWKGQNVREHLNRAMAHIVAYQMGHTADAHLEHALCRLMFAVDLLIELGDKAHELMQQQAFEVVRGEDTEGLCSLNFLPGVK